MPEVIKQDKTTTIEAAYGDGVLKVEVRNSIPWYVMMRMQGLDKLGNFDSLPIEEQFEMTARFFVVSAKEWDLTENGKPLPITEKTFGELPPSTALELITKFAELLPGMMEDFTKQAEAAKKSRGGDISLSHGRKGGSSRRKH